MSASTESGRQRPLRIFQELQLACGWRSVPMGTDGRAECGGGKRVGGGVFVDCVRNRGDILRGTLERNKHQKQI